MSEGSHGEDSLSGLVNEILKDTPFTLKREPEKRVCRWTPKSEDADEWLATACGWIQFEGKKRASWNFCPFCGGEIEEVK